MTFIVMSEPQTTPISYEFDQLFPFCRVRLSAENKRSGRNKGFILLQHEADLFDPFKVLDYSQRIRKQLDGKKPLALARFNTGIEKVEVRRYVLRVGKLVTSVYIIFVNS